MSRRRPLHGMGAGHGTHWAGRREAGCFREPGGAARAGNAVGPHEIGHGMSDTPVPGDKPLRAAVPPPDWTKAPPLWLMRAAAQGSMAKAMATIWSPPPAPRCGWRRSRWPTIILRIAHIAPLAPRCVLGLEGVPRHAIPRWIWRKPPCEPSRGAWRRPFADVPGGRERRQRGRGGVSASSQAGRRVAANFVQMSATRSRRTPTLMAPAGVFAAPGASPLPGALRAC